MGNNGLKNKNEIINKAIGNTEVLCNISKYHGKVTLKINLLSTLGVNKTNFFLYHDLTDSTNIGFGYGTTCSLYQRIAYTNNKYDMITYDGLDYEFNQIDTSKYHNEELNQTILKQSGTAFRLFDGFGNIYDYNSDSNYPSLITYGESGYSLSLSVTNNRLTEVRVKSGSRVVSTIGFTYTLINGNYYATTIVCTKPNNTYNISYGSGKISSITSNITGQSDLLTNMSYVYNSYELTVKDNITSARCKVEYGPDSQEQSDIIDKIEEDYYINNTSIDKVTTLITQGNDYVKVYDNHGNVEYLYYNNSEISYIFDNNNSIRKCLYNNQRPTGVYTPTTIDKNIVSSYNIIKNGYFEESSPLNHWVISGTTNYSIIDDSARPLSSLLGSKYLKIKNTGTSCFISQEIEKRGSQLDNYTLVLWLKEISIGDLADNDFSIEVNYHSNVYGTEILTYPYSYFSPHKTWLSNEWYPIVIDVSKNNNFDSISFKINLLSSGLELGIDGLLLINSKVVVESSYYAFGKKEKQENRDEIINYIHNYHDDYFDIDKLGMIIDNDGRVTKYTYDSDAYNVISEEKSNLFIQRTYDSSEKDNLLKEEITSDGKKLVKEYTYTTSNDFIQSEKGYDDSITSFYTDENRGKVLNSTYPNGNNMLTVYDYKDQIEIKEISGSNFLKDLNYTYENFGSFNEIKMSNNYKYDFDYTNNKISQIKVNNLILESISYLSTYPFGIEEIIKGTNGDKVKFEYNQKGFLSNIYYKLKGDSYYSLKYSYFYNNNLLSRVKIFVGSSYIERQFVYDSVGNIVKIYDPNNDNFYCNYIYDESKLLLKDINSISKKRIEILNINNKEMIASKDDLRISSLYQTGSLHKYYSFLNNGSNPLYLKLYSSTNQAYGITKLIVNYNNFSTNIENDNYYVALTSSSPFLKYAIPSEYLDNNGSLKKGSFGFLFIPSALSSIKTIFSIYDSSGSSRITVLNDSNNNLMLKIYDDSGENFAVHYFNKKCELNKINYFGISYAINSNYTSVKIRCVFNNEKYDFDSDSLYDILIFNQFSIGSYKNSSTTKSSFKLYSIMAMPVSGDGEPLLLSGLIKNYHLLKDIYETPVSQTTRTSLETYTSNVVNNLVDFIPLTSSFISREKRKPIHLNYRYDDECVRNKYFKYIDSINQNMLKLDGINLVYDLSIDNTFTVGMNVIFSNIYNSDYIYQFKDGTRKIGLLIKNNYLYIDCANNLTNTNIYVTTNTLYFISLGLDFVLSSDSLISNKYKVRIVCNSNSYETTVDSDKINSNLLLIGSSGMNEEVDHFMDGFINSLCYKNTYMSVASINSLIDELKPIKTETVTDGFGRIEKSKVINGSLKLEKTLSYKQVEDTPSTVKDTMFISSEITKKGNTTLLQRSYEYGTGYSYGNITKIRENNSLVNQYYYNEKGYLTSSYDIPYGKNDNFEYDDNGNITRKLTRQNSDGSIINDVLFYYDTTWPDRLVQVGSKKIDYDSDSIGCPKHYGYFSGNTFTSGITYSWRCSKLIGLTDSINSKTISYDYDEEGKRISKTVNNVSHNYYYEGNRILTEIYGNNRLDFLYDENDNVIGFDYTTSSTTSRYYYIKNILGDIIKIIDSSGSVVVSYLYSSYGEILSVTGTLASTVGTINPFRYRSYYYDTDTSMYYLKTRYYNPEWCRFISSDNISYLEYDNPLGVILFSYCSNNPIMDADSEGTFSWKRFWSKAADIAATAFSVAVGIAVGVATRNKGIGVAAFVMSQYVINSVYYECISTGETDLNNSSYNIDDKEFRYLTRWERLDYTKQETQSTSYGLNEIRFFGEYTTHMWAWGIFKGAYGKNIPIISSFAERAREADISPDHGETGKNRWQNIVYYFFGILGA